jgi:hypothetical protein
VIRITGAAGNLGGMLARHLPPSERPPRLIVHEAPLARHLAAAAPFTRDFITIGRVPRCGDTRRMRAELVPDLIHPTLETPIR